jgi:F-type H+-transporting ATPase subunit b
MTSDCRHAQPRPLRASAWLLALVLAGFVCAFVPPAAQAQEHAAPVAAPAQHGGPAAAGEAEEHHDEGLMPTVARLFNFALLAGALFYFLKTPVATYLTSRSGQIRQDLVTAAEMRATATAQLAAIEQKLKALPAELDALKARGADDVKAEQGRIAQAAAVERERLIEQTRREIEMRLRVARRDLTELAAKLAVGIAEERIKRTITPDDQLRLVDRYTSQLKEAR